MTVEEETSGTQGADALAALERFDVENDDLLVLESLIGRFNIFDALRINEVEIRHSNFLAFIFDPAESHGQGQIFLEAFLRDLLKQAPSDFPLSPIDLDGTGLRCVEIRREWKHIDLLIMCQKPRFFVVIENKIRSKEGPDQLSDYEKTMQTHYPNDRPLYVLLTLNADEASENKWMPYSHADIYRVLKSVRETHGKAIGEDVLVFLDHYLNLIGTRFMNDSPESKRIDELCRRIYTKHRQALDLIHERASSRESSVLAEVGKAIEEDHRWEVIARGSNYIDFVPKAWLDWLPQLGIKGNLRSWIHVRLASNYGRLGYAVEMAPMRDLAKRIEIVPELRAKCSGFGFTPARAKEVKNSQCRISAVQSILEWDEDDDPAPEGIRVAATKALHEMYPKLEKLALVLKPLCELPASAP
jgi:hypothetical protein